MFITVIEQKEEKAIEQDLSGIKGAMYPALPVLPSENEAVANELNKKKPRVIDRGRARKDKKTDTSHRNLGLEMRHHVKRPRTAPSDDKKVSIVSSSSIVLEAPTEIGVCFASSFVIC